jgi:RHS repeat-associated protein
VRTSKTINGVEHTYLLNGTKVLKEVAGEDILWYDYDAAGNILAMTLNGTTYYYEKNVQGDIIGPIDDTVAKVVEYLYDSWGKVISTTGTLADSVGVKNPYRYRGYRYDAETGLYYLQSRYYDADMGRFVNADGQLNLKHKSLGLNTYTYCINNPIMFIDLDGKDAVIITTPGATWGFGHTSLLIQDSDGTWWYFHYDKGNLVRMEKIPSDVSDEIFKDGVTVNLITLDKWLKKEDIYAQKEMYKYKNYEYLTGDFSNSATYAKGLLISPPAYKVWGNNCLNMCIDVLLGDGLTESQREYFEQKRHQLLVPNWINWGKILKAE